MALARTYERRLNLEGDATAVVSRPSSRPQRTQSSTPKQSPLPGASGSTPPTPGAPVKPSRPTDGHFKRLAPEEMAQQRVEGLCFNCPEKFSKEHAKVCPGRGFYFLDLGDDSPPADSTTEDDIQISLHAVTGIRTDSTLQLPTVIGATTASSAMTSRAASASPLSHVRASPSAWPMATAFPPRACVSPSR